jgi:hypothetical protein
MRSGVPKRVMPSSCIALAASAIERTSTNANCFSAEIHTSDTHEPSPFVSPAASMAWSKNSRSDTSVSGGSAFGRLPT